MIKLEIVLDREKIEREGLYDVEKMLGVLDWVFVEENNLPCLLKGDGVRVYRGNDSERDYGVFWGLIMSLRKNDVFIDNVKSLVWYNSDEGIDENDFYVEDILGQIKEKARVG